MNRSSIIKVIVIMFTFTFFSIKSYAIDVVKFHRQPMPSKKSQHNIEVVRRALEVTEIEYGAFQLNIINVEMSVGRMLTTTFRGEILNAVIVPANEQWDSFNIPIRLPVRLGLLSYRTLLINEADLGKFANVLTIQDLNKYRAGLVKGWATTEVYKSNNMNLLETGHVRGLFLMLNKQRFDYIPRGIYEIHDELSDKKSILTDIVIEPTLALHIPTSAYVYVSPTEPRIAKRIELGLNKLLESGELKTILFKHYGGDIDKANLSKRNIINIENPYHNKNDKINEKHFLLVH